MMHLMKLLVALALAAAPSARGMAPYVPTFRIRVLPLVVTKIVISQPFRPSLGQKVGIDPGNLSL